MRYKCIKDFWMEDSELIEGCKPAFVKGKVYEFRRKGGDFVTDKDEQNHLHYMPPSDIMNFFELVEDNEETEMNNQKWQEGKRYKFKQDMEPFFRNDNISNDRIANIIGTSTFTVKKVTDIGVVQNLVEFDNDDVNLYFWFTQSEVRFFELVEQDVGQQVSPTNVALSEDVIIDAFLDKLQYVLLTDSSVGDNVCTSGHSGVLNIETEHGTIYGVASIRSFINIRYDLLQQEYKYKKNNELMERKAKLEAELAEVNKELGGIL